MKRTTIGCSLTFWIFVCAFFMLLSGFMFPFDFVIGILFGWIAFIGRVTREVRVNWVGIASGLIALSAFFIGLHVFARWLSTNLRAKQDNVAPRPKWRIRWTLQIVALIVFAFVAGISMVGITHQCAWLATSKEPLVTNAYGPHRWAPLRSRSNLHGMGKAIKDFESKNSALLSGATGDAQGRSLHSWQTMLLPYLEEETLFKKIDLSKPWNAPENDSQFKFAIPIFLNPSVEDDPKDGSGHGLSHYAGNAYVLGGTEPCKKADFQGGESRTIVAGEAAGNFKPWGMPGNWRDPKKGINRSPDGFGGNRNGPTIFLKADGGTVGLADDIDPLVFQSLCTPGGTERLAEE